MEMKDVWDFIGGLICFLGGFVLVVLIVGVVLSIGIFIHKVWVHVTQPVPKLVITGPGALRFTNINFDVAEPKKDK